MGQYRTISLQDTRPILPSLQAAYSGRLSQLNLSARLHSQIPPVWEINEAYFRQLRRDPESLEPYIDGNYVCHCCKRGEPSSDLSEESGALNFICLARQYARIAERDLIRTWPLPAKWKNQPRREAERYSSARSMKSRMPQNRERLVAGSCWSIAKSSNARADISSVDLEYSLEVVPRFAFQAVLVSEMMRPTFRMLCASKSVCKP